MQPAENKDYSRDVILRLSPTRNTIIVEEQKPAALPPTGKLILWSCTMLSTRAMPAMIIWTAAFFRNTAFTYPCPPRRSISCFGIRNCGQM